MPIDMRKLRNLRDATIMACHALPEQPTAEDLAGVRDQWLGFKLEVFEQLGEDPMAMHEPWPFIKKELFGHSEWKKYNRLRVRAWESSDEGKKKKAKRNERLYYHGGFDPKTKKPIASLRERRSKDEAYKARQREARKARYQKQKAERQAQAEVDAVLETL